jgi:hypothetical protein
MVFWDNGTSLAPAKDDTNTARGDKECVPEPAVVVLIAAPPFVSARLKVVAVTYFT